MPDQLTELVQRALTDDRGLRDEVKATDEAIADIVRMAGGDARKSLTILEPRLARSPATKPAKRAHADPSSPPKSWLR